MEIVRHPHPALRHKAAPVTSITPELHLQVGEMLELMYANGGLGLAAPQVGLPYRVLVVNPSGDSSKKDLEVVAINPEIVARKGTNVGVEGCLSFPGLFVKVRRAEKVRVRAYDLNGDVFELSAGGLDARVWQHEVDHLDGVLFVDRGVTV